MSQRIRKNKVDAETFKLCQASPVSDQSHTAYCSAKRKQRNCLKSRETIFYKNIQEHLDKKSSLCYIYMESNFRTGLSDFYCFFYCMEEKWKNKS